MTDYLERNRTYWERGYSAPNVEASVFRFYGRILVHDFGLTGSGEITLDFGCGQGATVNFFHRKGFDARGCDISETDLVTAKVRYPHLTTKLSLVSPRPSENALYCAAENVRVVTAIQSLYYLSDTDFAVCIEKIHRAMNPGAVIFATMMGEQCREFFNNSEPAEDGLRRVAFKNDRLDVSDYYMSFIRDEEHLRQKFSLFRPLHIGHYAMQLRSDEGDGFHWTFCGVRD